LAIPASSSQHNKDRRLAGLLRSDRKIKNNEEIFDIQPVTPYVTVRMIRMKPYSRISTMRHSSAGPFA
jgi:hypothetical protein